MWKRFFVLFKVKFHSAYDCRRIIAGNCDETIYNKVANITIVQKTDSAPP